MKKTILALAIAGSLVLLTGCDAEDDVVDNYGSTIKTTHDATAYAGKVNAINELVLHNVIKHCVDSSFKISKSTCPLDENITTSLTGNIYHLSGDVKLSIANNIISIETLNDKKITLKKGKKVDFEATFNNSSDNHHKITFKEKSNDTYTVTFTGQYLDNDKDQFQSHSITGQDFTYSENLANKFEDSGKATLKGKGDSSSWTWDILIGEAHIIAKI